ncbi:aminotransferase class I/II-fold pyridoxal phosphate-dependent enzyme [Streptomyces mobaraensis]|uniref:aminotransferase class I/II-fold pyridoxal phosphate-dependent enzyme n=1 Tax=Streptomyces mobaraensis TaxID=35621 RepID=UPI00332B7746
MRPAASGGLKRDSTRQRERRREEQGGCSHAGHGGGTEGTGEVGGAGSGRCEGDPPPPGTVEAVHDEADRHLNRYPDADCRLLREAVAGRSRVPADMVAVGNGTDELVLVVSLPFLRAPGTTILTTATTFPGYVVSAAAVGRVPVTVPLDGADLPVEGVRGAHAQDGVLVDAEVHAAWLSSVAGPDERSGVRAPPVAALFKGWLEKRQRAAFGDNHRS